MKLLLQLLTALLMLSPLRAQPAKHPVLTVQRQRIVQSCGAIIDTTSSADGFLLSSVVGLTSIGTLTSVTRGKAYLGFWVPIPVILSADDQATDIVAGARIWSWPNPFRDHVSIDVQVPERSLVEANIYSSIGKHVAALTVASRRSDGVTFTWDGTTDDALEGASGIYLVRVFVQEPLHQRRIVYSSSLTRVR
ncbi:MAG TPA: hypothetical protein DCZ59_08065 [Bacteroidetes bacterium]|nr:hypothetical protein [Bacteroidota bacterium]